MILSFQVSGDNINKQVRNDDEKLDITLKNDFLLYSSSNGFSSEVKQYFEIGTLNQKEYWYEVFGDQIQNPSNYDEFMSSSYFYYESGGDRSKQEYVLFTFDMSSFEKIENWAIEFKVKDYYSKGNSDGGDTFSENDIVTLKSENTSSNPKTRSDYVYNHGNKSPKRDREFYFTKEGNIVKFYSNIDDESIDLNGMFDNNEFVVSNDYVDEIYLKANTEIIFKENDLRKIKINELQTEINFTNLYLNETDPNSLIDMSYYKLEEMLIESISFEAMPISNWDDYELQFYYYDENGKNCNKILDKDRHFDNSNILFSIAEKNPEGYIEESNIFSLNLPILFFDASFISYGEEGVNYYNQENNYYIDNVSEDSLTGDLSINLYLNNAVEIKIKDSSFIDFSYSGNNVKIKSRTNEELIIEFGFDFEKNIQSDSITFTYERVENNSLETRNVTFNFNYVFFSPIIMENNDVNFTTSLDVENNDDFKIGVKEEELFNYSIIDSSWFRVEISSEYVKYFSEINIRTLYFDEGGDKHTYTEEIINPNKKFDKEFNGFGFVEVTFKNWFGDEYNYLVFQTDGKNIEENIIHSLEGDSLVYDGRTLFYDYYSTTDGQESYEYMEEKEMNENLIDYIDANILKENIIPKMESTFDLNDINELDIDSISNVGEDYRDGRVKWYQIQDSLEEEINNQIKEKYNLNKNDYSISWLNNFSDKERIKDTTTITFEINSVFWSNTISSSSEFSFKLNMKWAMSGITLFILIILFIVFIIFILLLINSLYKRKVNKGIRG